MSGNELTIDCRAGNVRYYPHRDGPIDMGWNYTDSGPKGILARQTTFSGARLEIDWVGVAVELHGSATSGSYRLSLDNSGWQNGNPDFEVLGKFEGLASGNHTVTLEVTSTSDAVYFTRAVLVLGLESGYALFFHALTWFSHTGFL
jgi:hypothetical protein